jgi:agmatinase
MSTAPRYTGIRTFANLPHLPLSDSDRVRPDVAVVGIPFDTATSWRAGARFGPEAIRSASALLRPWHPVHGVDVLASQRVLDMGDVAITPGNAKRSIDQIERALAPLRSAGVIPLVLGGDHTIALGELRAQASAAGEAVPFVLLDAHADTWDEYYGERLFHGTFLRRAVEEGILDAEHSLVAGLRGPLYAASDLEQARALGLELLTIEQLRDCGPSGFAQCVCSRVGQRPIFLGFDIDVIDPSAAPGTGTPEVGGLSSAEALALLRALGGMRFVGFDVVEVSPPYDSPGQITALLAANIAYEMLALAALASSAGAP